MNRNVAPRTRPYRQTVALPPAVHGRFGCRILAAEEQAGHTVDKRAVELALIDQLLGACGLDVRVRAVLRRAR